MMAPLTGLDRGDLGARGPPDPRNAPTWSGWWLVRWCAGDRGGERLASERATLALLMSSVGRSHHSAIVWSRGAVEPWSHGAVGPWSHGAVMALRASMPRSVVRAIAVIAWRSAVLWLSMDGRPANMTRGAPGPLRLAAGSALWWWCRARLGPRRRRRFHRTGRLRLGFVVAAVWPHTGDGRRPRGRASHKSRCLRPKPGVPRMSFAASR